MLRRQVMIPVALVCVAALAAELAAAEARPERTQKIEIDLDLTEYRKLAATSDGIIVGTIVGTRTRTSSSGRTLRELEVRSRSADGAARAEFLRPYRDVLPGLLKHVGRKYLFFWRTSATKHATYREAIACFELDEKHRKVLKWLRGGAKQHTLFNPECKDVLPDGLKPSSRVVREGHLTKLVVRLMNRRPEPVDMAREVAGPYAPYTGTAVIGADGAVVWPKWQCTIQGWGTPKTYDYVTLAPGKHLEFVAFHFRRVGDPYPDEALKNGIPMNTKWLRPGKHYFRFAYHSDKCEPHGGKQPLRTRIIIYGSFEVKP